MSWSVRQCNLEAWHSPHQWGMHISNVEAVWLECPGSTGESDDIDV